MLFSELLRITVLLVGGVATALGALAVLVIQDDDATFAAIFGGGWWLLAAIIGMVLGTSARAAEAISPALRGARTATSLPDMNDGRIAFMRLWPIGAFAVVCGVAGVIFPQVAAIGAGYALLIALLWRRREAAVRAIEDRDGVRFYVEPTSAFEPIRVVRTPGLYRDRPPKPKPPPPPRDPD
jgi:hypothetical protein